MTSDEPLDRDMQALRAQAFEIRPASLGITPTTFSYPVWGLVMETGHDEAVSTLVAIADGTTSLYFSNGGGIIGGGEHDAVLKAAKMFLAGGNHFFDRAEAVAEFPMPDPGQTFFYFLSFEEVRTYAAQEDVLGAGDDPLSGLFFAGHDVITRLCEIPQVERQGPGPG